LDNEPTSANTPHASYVFRSLPRPKRPFSAAWGAGASELRSTPHRRDSSLQAT